MAAEFDLDEFLEKCRSHESYYDEPPGWGKIAAMSNFFGSADVINSFATEGMRVIQYHNGRLAFLKGQLRALDRKEDTHLRCLTKHQTRLPGQPDVREEYDVLMEEIEKEWALMAKSVRRYKEMCQLHPVSRARHRDFLARITQDSMLEPDALAWLDTPELVSISKPLPKIMDRFIHTRVGEMLGSLAPSPSPPDCEYNLVPLSYVLILKAVATTLPAMAVLAPVGILVLCDLSAAASFGVVVAFTFLFSLAVNVHEDTDARGAMISAWALSAVLVTTMVQLVSFAPR
ncbi:hypothetical protein OQA88_6522 [Cercophora sp. LCS_1]